MIKNLMVAITFLSIGVVNQSSANPKPMGIEIGKTTVDEVASSCRLTLKGVHVWSGGNLYEMPTHYSKIDGASKVVVIANERNIITAIFVDVPKANFMRMKVLLDQKYTLVNFVNPHVGNKEAVYRDGQATIALKAPHMSFDMSLSYEHESFIQAGRRFIEQKHKEEQKKLAGAL